jgi:ankyrin repeat protein
MWAAGHSNDVPEVDGVKTVETLLSHGARFDDADDRGRTALMIAAEVGRPAVVELLLKRGAKAEIKDKTGLSALDLAASEAVRKALGGKERASIPR